MTETKRFQLLVGRATKMIDGGATESEIADRLKLTEAETKKIMDVIHLADINRRKMKTE